MKLLTRIALFLVIAPAFAVGVLSLSLIVNAQTAAVTATTSAGTAATLQSQVLEKQQQLNAINTQLASTTANLKQVQSQGTTLQQQLKLINGNISTLNLGIQADTITGQQLQLEIQQLSGNISDITASIGQQQAAIASDLQELERNDSANGNLLALFLKSGTLADGVFEANSLLDLRSQLASNIDNLKNLHNEYNEQITSSTAKVQSVTANQNDLQNKVSIVQDQQTQKQTLLQSTKNQESVFQQQLAALNKQQSTIANDMNAIEVILRTKIDPSTLPALGAGVLAIPVQGDTQADITQGYGATAFAQTEYVKKWHNGVDFAASIGTPILAAEAGTIAAQGNEDLYCPKGAYGKFIVINHNDGLTTLYGHLSKILVAAGQIVTRGQIIGYSGATGDVTGPHLHFTVFAQSTYYLDKSPYCGPLPEGGDLNPLGYLF